MSEFNYLTGRPELFENAPDSAMVVLEHDDGRLFFAVAHDLGAHYWNEDGTPGSKVGLIALHKKTRIVASRIRASGLPPVEPKRDPIPKSRLDRMQQAQNGLKRAVSQPAPTKPKPEPKPEPVKVDPPKVEPKFPVGSDKRLMEVPKVADAMLSRIASLHAADTSGFVSLFELAKAAPRTGEPFLTVGKNGNLNVSLVIASPGEFIDVQYNKSLGLIRIGKVATGGRKLNKARQFSGAGIAKLFVIPEGQASIRIPLTEVDGWWHGKAELAIKSDS